VRILLLYPPPWKIPSVGDNSISPEEGPPEHWKPEDRFSGDEITIPYGLLSLAGQAKKAGHEVTLLNLYQFAWQDVVRIISNAEADLYGLSCFTSNRRGTLYTACLIRKLYPGATIFLGGPHATALPREILQHCKAVNGIVLGEGEKTFLELIHSLENGALPQTIAGMAWRTAHGIHFGPQRQRIKDLDTMTSPYDYCKGHIFLSSRGCPGNCSFCGSPSMWGRKVRFHSAKYTLDVLETMVNTHRQKYVFIKDDTFTANRKRVLEICQGIRKRKLNFLWSCDTRVDSLDEEVLHAMRRAGCQFISFGVESGSQEILNTINKRTTPQDALRATEMAKRYGFTIRFYMMALNRGETAETLKTSIDFIIQAKPNQFLFSFLTLYPGTREFAIAESKGLITRETFFTCKDHYFSFFPENEYDDQMKKIIRWINTHAGVREFWDYTVADRQKILDIFPDLSAAHMDLGKALYHSRRYREAEACFRKAMEMGFPMPGIALNYLACLAVERGKIKEALEYLKQAKTRDNHHCVEQNLKSLYGWLTTGAYRQQRKPLLVTYHEFEPHQSATQPIVPAPITIYDRARAKQVRLVPR